MNHASHPPSASRDPLAGGHVAALEGVRGLAIVVVFIHNVAQLGNGEVASPLQPLMLLVAAGWVGVQLFFVLSGFLITGILLDARGAARYFRTFYVRRTLRIFPLYYAVLAFLFFLSPHVPRLAAWTLDAQREQWWYWTYLSNWISPFGEFIPGLTHFWSLAVEEQFYLVWPLAVALLAPRRLLVLCATLIALTPFVRLGMRLADLPVNVGYTFTIARWDALACGAVVAILLREAAGAAWLARLSSRLLPWCIAGCVAIALAEGNFRSSTLSVQVAGQSLVGLLSGVLVLYAVTPSSAGAERWRDAMSARWLRFLGKYSYALYIFHVPFQYAVSKVDARFFGQASIAAEAGVLVAHVAVVGALSVAAALVSWRVLEQPCLRLKDRLAPRAVAA